MANTKHLGSLKGQFSVDSNGGAIYSIALQLPPGTAGMMPSLTLVYNSGAGNGLLGMGWSLQGLSSIGRAGATVAQDGFIGSVKYDENDRFIFDGQRLVAIRGEYGREDALYHTEIESWRKVTPVYSHTVPSRSGPDSFLVHTKDGKLTEYGCSRDSQVQASKENPSIRVWALNKITDLNGNYLTVTYREDPAGASFHPERIDYTGNEGAGLAPQRSVRFTYEARPDHVPHYLGGYRVQLTERLSKIEALLDDKLVLQYGFVYEQGTATGRSRLVSIIQADSEGVALSPTLFEWQDGDPAIFGSPEPVDSFGLPSESSLLPMDVNGDGLIDLVCAYSDPDDNLQIDILLAKPGGAGFEKRFHVQPTGLAYGGTFLPMDVNGDGCIDLVYATEDNNALGLTVLTATFIDGQWTLIPGPINGAYTGPLLPWGGRLLSMDVDGDGKTDLVYVTEQDTGPGLNILFSNGTSFAPSAEDKTAPNVGGDGQFIPMDYNGDGLTDLVYAVDNQGQLALTLFRSEGRRGLIQQSYNPLPPLVNLEYGGALAAIDANGDGMIDLVYAYQDENTLKLRVILSNGVGFEPQEAVPTGFGYVFDSDVQPVVLPMDVNGDGLTDIVVASSTVSGNIVTGVFLSTGTGFVWQPNARQPLSSVAWGGNFLPLDLDGNGKTDLLYAIGDDSGLLLTRSLAAGAYPDLLTTITNGLGGGIRTRYKPLTDPTVYSKGTAKQSGPVQAQSLFNNRVSGATFPLPSTLTLGNSTPGAVYASQTVDFPKYVISGYVKDDGRGNEYDYGYVNPELAYFYVGARIDLTGRGWLGFESIAMHDNNLQTKTVTGYNQPFPLTSTVNSSEIRRSTDGALMTGTSMEYRPAGEGSKTQQVLVQEARTDFYNFSPPGKAPDSTHTKTHEYDDFGNVIETVESSTEPGALPLFTRHAYLDDPDRWRLGYRVESKTSSDTQFAGILGWDQTSYDPATMNKTAHRVWDDQKQRWLVSTFQYDQYGNRTSKTDPSGAQSLMSFDETYHAFVVAMKSPPNQNGERLVTSFDYYWQFGVQKSKTGSTLGDTGPGQIIQQQNIDGLGRVIEVLGLDPSDNLVALSRSSWQEDQQGVYQEILTLLDWTELSWHWQRHYLDAFGRVYRSVSLGPDGKTPVISNKTFDSRSNTVRQSLPYYEGSVPLFITRTYDAYERLIEEVKPVDNGSTRTTREHKNTFTVIQTEAADSSSPRRTIIQYSTFNSRRVITNRTDADNFVTIYSYDQLARMVSSTDPAGVINRVTYDSLGRQIRVESFKSGEILYETSLNYDDLNRQTSQVAASGHRVTIDYDALKRPLSKKTGTQDPTIFTYDVPTLTNSIGRLSSVRMPDGTSYQYAYTPYGDHRVVAIDLNGATHTFEKTFGPVRNVLRLTYPDGFAIVNGYNAAGQLTSVAPALEGGDEPRHFATYDRFTASGKAGLVSSGNSMQDLSIYNQAEQLKSRTLSGPNREATVSKSFQWNPLDELESIQDELDPAKTQGFSYDAVGRLIRATGDFKSPQEFNYDPAGNLTLKDGLTYKYQGYRIIQGTQGSEPVFSATYDLDGNMTSATRLNTTRVFQYDEESRLIEAGRVTFNYDYTGRRLTKRVAGGPTTYYVSPYFEIVVFPDGSTQSTRNVISKHGLIASITRADAGSPGRFAGVPALGTFYFHKNHLNSTTVVSDERGDTYSTIEYLPYGEISSIAGPDTVRQKFTGKEFDEDTGLYYFQSRYYDPQIGRFITPDDRLGGPVHRRDVFNRYAYVLNNPVTGIDPTGHSVWSDIGDVFEHGIAKFVTLTAPDLFLRASSATAGFFNDDVKPIFANKITETVLSYAIDGALIVGGIAVLATTPFGGPASTLIGSTLLGAGIGGLTYNLTHQNWKTGTVSGDWSWGDYLGNLGIGALTGFISGGVAAGAGAAVDAAAEAGQAAFEAGAAGRILVNTAAGALGNATGGFVGGIASNALSHQSLFAGVAGATLLGGVLGGAGGAISEGIGASLAKRLSYIDLDLGVDDADSLSIDEIGSEPAPGRMYIPNTVRNNAAVAFPAVFFTGLDALLLAPGIVSEE